MAYVVTVYSTRTAQQVRLPRHLPDNFFIHCDFFSCVHAWCFLQTIYQGWHFVFWQECFSLLTSSQRVCWVSAAVYSLNGLRNDLRTWEFSWGGGTSPDPPSVVCSHFAGRDTHVRRHIDKLYWSNDLAWPPIYCLFRLCSTLHTTSCFYHM